MSLLESIKQLIPCEIVDVYGQQIEIRPLSLESIGLLVPKIQTHWSNIQGLGITMESLSGDDNKPQIIKILSYFLSNGIDVLEDISGVDKEVFTILPLDKSFEIISAVVRVNVQSGEDFLKNWNSLVKTLTEANLLKLETK